MINAIKNYKDVSTAHQGQDERYQFYLGFQCLCSSIEMIRFIQSFKLI
jgi:hypothetical protein